MSDSARRSPRGLSVTDKIKSLGSDHIIQLILDTQNSTRPMTAMESAIPPSTSSRPVSGVLLSESPCSRETWLFLYQNHVKWQMKTHSSAYQQRFDMGSNKEGIC